MKRDVVTRDRFIEGTKGSGKTLFSIMVIKEYLLQGRKVAVNFDLNLEHFDFPKDVKIDVSLVYRIPNIPRVSDLRAIGYARDIPTTDESDNGLLVLDEAAVLFDSRSWSQKGRKEVIIWLRNGRKYGWNIDYLVQDIDSLDAQIRQSFCDYLVSCSRLDRLSIPYVGWLLNLFMLGLPKAHFARIYLGKSKDSTKDQTVWYKGKNLYRCYNTNEIFESLESEMLHYQSRYDSFKNDPNIISFNPKDGFVEFDMRATCTLLHPDYFTGVRSINELSKQLKDLSVKRKRVMNGLSFEPSLQKKIINKKKQKNIFLRYAPYLLYLMVPLLIYVFYPSSGSNAVIQNDTNNLSDSLSVSGFLLGKKEEEVSLFSVGTEDSKVEDSKVKFEDSEEFVPTTQDELNSYFAKKLGGERIELTGVSVLGSNKYFYLNLYKSDGSIVSINNLRTKSFSFSYSVFGRELMLIEDNIHLTLGLNLSDENHDGELKNSRFSFRNSRVN